MPKYVQMLRMKQSLSMKNNVLYEKVNGMSVANGMRNETGDGTLRLTVVGLRHFSLPVPAAILSFGD